MNDEDLRADFQRQGDGFYEAIEDAVCTYAKMQPQPSLNALIAALSATLGGLIASIPPHLHDGLRAEIDRAISAAAAGERIVPRITTVRMGGGDA